MPLTQTEIFPFFFFPFVLFLKLFFAPLFEPNKNINIFKISSILLFPYLFNQKYSSSTITINPNANPGDRVQNYF